MLVQREQSQLNRHTKGIATDVNELEECLEKASEAAQFVSYFGAQGYPFYNTCLYLTKCDTLGMYLPTLNL